MTDINKLLQAQLEQLKAETERITNEAEAIRKESESFDWKFKKWFRK